ncbi:ATP-binding cassette domain-containing protein [Bauldia sp.]|uniref:ATP-binding cassette domain-containing protein n=1 Tax=Bauldia sp. TaxID=2575872 RepID=UPI003BACBB99
MALRLNNVSVRIANHVLIPPLDLAVNPGEIVTIMGPSGSGKSTLLAYIGGTMGRPFEGSGHVFCGRHEITGLPPERRRIGMLFQDDLLFPHLSVGGNIAFGVPANIQGQKRKQRIDDALADSGLAGFADRDPGSLSGGQRARVALLRTLLSEPEALLLDEPFGKLDTTLREGFRRFVFSRARARELPVLLVTHDCSDAEAAGGPILEINQTETGTVIETAAPIAGVPESTPS